MTNSDTRSFPMQHSQTPIPWAEAEWFYRCYAALHGRQQSLERLAERGGSSRAEVRVCAQEVVEHKQAGLHLRAIHDLPAGMAPSWLDTNLVAAVEAIWGA